MKYRTRILHHLGWTCSVGASFLLSACHRPAEPLPATGAAETGPAPPHASIRVAAANGLVTKGPWAALAAEFTRQTQCDVITIPCRGMEVVAQVSSGKADAAIVHHGVATMSELNAGNMIPPVAWAQSGYVIIGPTTDPAQIRGENTGSSALRKIREANAGFIEADGQATRQLMEDLLAPLPATNTAWKPIPLPQGTTSLALAGKLQAYAIVPVADAKLESLAKDHLETLISNDPTMVRSFEITYPKTGTPNSAQALKAFLTSPSAAAIMQAQAPANAMPLKGLASE